MPLVVAVGGGSGGLGRRIVDALKADNRYEPLILARKVKPEVEKETGVRIAAADYTNIDSLVKLLEENKVDTVISTISSGMDASPELNLIQAADQSKTTRRFIPCVWSGFNYKPEHGREFIFAQLKLDILDALHKTSLEWTAIYPGVFLDYYSPGIPSDTMIHPTAVDVQANVAGIPGSGDYPVYFTHTSDIGKYTVAALSLEKWEKKYFVFADKKTWNELVSLAEEVKGVKFRVAYDSIEKLEKGQVTELPGHQAAYEAFGGEAAKPMIMGMVAKLSSFFVQGFGEFGPGNYLNEIFPDIKPLTLREGLEKSYPK